ncbi:uncharacterized protein LOC112554489 [Pomacea canaliculata]|nr:uncharacterized protein LOC112554489 [Pomacea canaliculata]
MATSSSARSTTTTTVPSTLDKDTPSPGDSKDPRVIFPVPAISVLLNGSEVGPKVIVPLRGLFVPGSNVLLNVTEEMTSPQEMTQVSGAGARHVSVRSQSLSVQTVFSRYWPAILGLTVGTMFLVAALMTSLACRQQRLFVQRRQWLDTPQHLTSPPDISEYTSSSSSLTSDNTRSSANFT